MPNEYERAYYEAESFWHGEALRDPANLRRIRETAELVPDDVWSLLDVGCGNGVFGEHLEVVRPEVRVVGVDRSEAALRQVRTPKRQGDITHLPAADLEFDCVTCLEVIEHLPADTFGEALRELLRVSKRYVIIGVPYRERIERNVTQCPQCRSTFNVDLHLRSFDDDTLRFLFPPAEARLVRSIYPGSGDRLVGIADAFDLLGRVRRCGKFVSPVCPVCGYSEGDRTVLSVEARPDPVRDAADGATTAMHRSGARRLAGRAFRKVEPVWPRRHDHGYWVGALFERVGASSHQR